MTQIRRPTGGNQPSRGYYGCLLCFVLITLFWFLTEEDLPAYPPNEPIQGTFSMRSNNDKSSNDLEAINSAPVDPTKALDQPNIYMYKRKCPGPEHPTLKSIQDCYPDATLQLPKTLSNNNKPICKIEPNNHHQPLTWTFLQDCLSGRRRYGSQTATKITQIHVIGERNSGTKWLQQELAQCFARGDTGIRSHRDFLRSKHFFQPPVRGTMASSLVIAIVRSPEEWVAAMREKPYHMPHHLQGFENGPKGKVVPLGWTEFLQRASQWSMPGQTTQDRAIVQAGQQDAASCVQGFSFAEVSPCQFNDTHIVPRNKWRGHMPIYELQRDGSGHPFDDLLKLRADKILNFVLEVPLLMQLGGFVVVRYEDLVRQGTRPFLERIAKMLELELPSACKPQPPKPERLGRRSIPPEARRWMEERLVLEMEQLLGYR